MTSIEARAFADATGAPAASLPERLSAARERKGVDVHRAERDTKIRARYLQALERGDYRALPGTVYTRGFLRSYAAYLGLDPDTVIDQWHGEDREDERRVARGAVRASRLIAVPRPVGVTHRRLTFSHGLVVPALLVGVVAVFAVYLSVQLLRFAGPPTLAVTAPAVAIVSVDTAMTSYLLRGTSMAGATISVATPGRDQPYRVSAGADGTWAAQVELRRGPNHFDITAIDPRTGKAAEDPAQVVIRVPLPVFDAPTAAPQQTMRS
jgi:helix-turn-helix protein